MEVDTAIDGSIVLPKMIAFAIKENNMDQRGKCSYMKQMLGLYIYTHFCLFNVINDGDSYGKCSNTLKESSKYF